MKIDYNAYYEDLKEGAEKEQLERKQQQKEQLEREKQRRLEENKKYANVMHAAGMALRNEREEELKAKIRKEQQNLETKLRKEAGQTNPAISESYTNLVKAFFPDTVQ